MDPTLNGGGSHIEIRVAATSGQAFDVDAASRFKEPTRQHRFCNSAEKSIFASARFIERFHEAANLSRSHSSAAVGGGRGHPREDFLAQASNIDG